jgi:hypothetical protein
MSEPLLPHDLRLGRFLLDDILRAFGFSHWFLTNITHASKMSVPLMTEIIAHLHTAELVEFSMTGELGIHYEQIPLITRWNLRRSLTLNEARTYIAKVLDRARELNNSPQFKYTIQNIYLYGSCLRGAEKPKDIDLAVELTHEGNFVPYVLSGPFGPRTEFDSIIVPLSLRKPAVISLHHIDEVRSIGAPHKLIWNAEKGAVGNAPILTTPVVSPSAKDYFSKLRMRAERQKQFDAISHYVESIQKWPVMSDINVDTAPDLSFETYDELQDSTLLLALAHLHCLPSGALREQVQSALTALRAQKSPNAPIDSNWQKAEEWVPAYIKASIRYNPWSFRPNGRLLKSEKKGKGGC